jgi:hypothetical protein
MAKKKTPMLDGPIAGQSLTSEPGARPWEQPAKYSTIEDTIAFYIEKMSEPKKMAMLLDKIEEGAPLTLIADTLQTQGVTQGLHSLDVGILISPVLIEYMKASAEQADVPYTIGTEEEDVANEEDEAMATLVAKEVYSAPDEEPMMEEQAMEEQEEMPVKKSGLMAPRKAEEMVEDGI